MFFFWMTDISPAFILTCKTSLKFLAGVFSCRERWRHKTLCFLTPERSSEEPCRSCFPNNFSSEVFYKHNVELWFPSTSKAGLVILTKACKNHNNLIRYLDDVNVFADNVLCCWFAARRLYLCQVLDRSRFRAAFEIFIYRFYSVMVIFR